MKIFAISLLLCALLACSAQDAPSCAIRPGSDIVTQLYTSVGETGEYFLDDFFEGFNLSYTWDVGLSAPPSAGANANINVTSAIQFINQNRYYDQEQIVGVSWRKENNSIVYVSRLSRQKEFKNVQYNLWMGKGDESSAPLEPFEDELKIPNGVDCLDIVQLSGDIVVLDCAQYLDDAAYHYDNVYYVINKKQADMAPPQVVQNYYVFEDLVSRKSLAYENGEAQFVVSGVFFDDLVAAAAAKSGTRAPGTETYINILRYDNRATPDGEYPDGVLVPAPPITKLQLGLANALNLADYDVLDDHIYALDFTQGVVHFEYYADSVQSVTRIPLAAFNATAKNAWGVDAAWEGGFVHLTVAFDNAIGVYRLRHARDDAPVRVALYALPVTLAGRPALQSNADFVTCQIGQLLYVFSRHRDASGLAEDSKYDVHGALENVQAHVLFDSNHVYTFDTDAAVSFLLRRPALIVDPVPQEGGAPGRQDTLVAVATSTLYGDTVECRLPLFSAYVLKNTTGLYRTFARVPRIEYEFSAHSPTRDVYLDQLFVGPDLTYSIGLRAGSNIVGDDDPELEFSVPELIQLNIPDANPTYWWFSYIVPVGVLDSHLQLHQRSDTFALQFFACLHAPGNIRSVKCTETHPAIPLTGLIQAFAWGYWNNEFQFAIVVNDDTTRIAFYDDAGNSVGALVVDGGDVTDLALCNNLLAIVNGHVVELWTHDGTAPVRAGALTRDYVQKWGLQGPWLPQRVLLHQDFPNLVVVKQHDAVVLVAAHPTRPQLLAQVPAPPGADSYTPVLTAQSLLIISYKAPNATISEYSLEDAARPRFLKSFDLYGFDLCMTSDGLEYAPIFAVSNYTGTLYVLASDANVAGRQLVVLSYRAHTAHVGALYRALRLNVTLDKVDVSQLSIAANGVANEDYVYVNAQGQQFEARFPLRAQALFTPESLFPEYAYTQTVEIKFNVTTLGGARQGESIKLVYVNKQLEVDIDAAAVQASGIIGAGRNWTEMPGAYDQLDLDVSQWFSGAVLSLKLECPDCQGMKGEDPLIQLKNRVQLLSQNDADQSLIQSLDFVEGGFYVDTLGLLFMLNEYEVTVYDQVLRQIGKAVPLLAQRMTEEDRCFQLVQGRDQSYEALVYAIAICRQARTWVAVPIDFTDINNPESLPAILMPNINEFGGAQFMDDKLLVLNLDAEQSRVYVYNFTNDVKTKQVIATAITSFGEGNPLTNLGMNVTAFEVARIDDSDSETQRMLFLANRYQDLYAIQVYIDNYTIVDDQSIQCISNVRAVDVLQQYNQYILPDMAITSFRIVDQYAVRAPDSTDGKTSLYFKTVLMTRETAIYEFTWEFTSTSTLKFKLLEGVIPTRTFGDYGSDTLEKFIDVYDQYFAVAYFNKTKTTYTVAVYHTERDNFSLLRDTITEPKFVSVVGGSEWKGVLTLDSVQALPFVLYDTPLASYDKQSTAYRLLQPSPVQGQSPRLFQLNYQNATIIADRLTVQRQEFTFTPVSDFWSKGSAPIIGNFSDEVTYIERPPAPQGPAYPSPGKPQPAPAAKGPEKQLAQTGKRPQKLDPAIHSEIGWIVVDSVLLGCIILGAIAYFVLRQWKKTKSLDDEQSSQQQPLVRAPEQNDNENEDSNLKA